MDNEDNKIVSSKFSIRAERAMRGEDIRRLRSIKMDNAPMDRKKMTNFLLGISKRTNRNVTLKDLQHVMERSQKYKIGMTWENKKKLLAWGKKHAEKLLVTKKPNEQPTVANAINKDRSARIIDAKAAIMASKFVSPKNIKTDKTAVSNSLGIASVQKGFSRGHSVNPASMGYSNAQEAPKNFSRLGASNSAGISRFADSASSGVTGSVNVPRR